MAIDAYMMFTPYGAAALKAESQVDFSKNKEPLAADFASGSVFEIESYSFDIEQTLNIGSQSSGAGAGKITFNPFTITRKVDMSSPTFFQMAASGKAFQSVALALRKSTGGDASGSIFLRFDFKLVAVKTMSWTSNDDVPMEDISFEYGGMIMRYNKQKPDGSIDTTQYVGGWNRVRNISDTDPKALIQ